MSRENFNTELCDYLAQATTPFHAVAEMVQRLQQAGFSALKEDQTWELTPAVLDGSGMAIQPRTDDMMAMPNFDYGTVVVRVAALD